MAHRQQVGEDRRELEKSSAGAETLWGMFWTRAQKESQATAFRFVGEGGKEVSEYSFATVAREALRQAAWLRANGQVGDRVLLTHSAGPEFIGSFLACMAAGMIAVPAFPPRRSGDRVLGLLRDSEARLALSDSVGRAAMRQVRGSEAVWKELRWPEAEELPGDGLGAAGIWVPRPQDIAYLQYTSGSTASPKGVMITHGGLLHNLAVCAEICEFKEGDRCLSWLPLFHDMGLVLAALMPLVKGGDSVYFAPDDFLKKPSLWPDLASRFRATHLAAPNSAYDLCVRRFREEDSADLDLSAVKFAVNGSEPVRAETCREFERVFGKYGLRPGVISAGYGLTEATLAVCAGRPLRGLAEVSGDGPNGNKRTLVKCGPQSSNRVTIVDPLNLRPCPDGAVGEIWIQGGSVAAGYWRNPEATRETFGGRLEGSEGDFLRTGDLGFVQDGEVVVSGRLKDLIILRGEHYHPQDIEAVAAKIHPDLEGGAAFAVEGPEGVESTVLVQEIQRRSRAAWPEIAAAIAEAVSREMSVNLDEIVLVPGPSVPRTGSGKVQRRACRDAYLSGTLKILTRVRPAAPGDPGKAGPDRCVPSPDLPEVSRRFTEAAAASAGRWRCLPAAESMWAAQMAAPQSNAYHIAFTIELDGRLERERMQKALDRLSREQVVLRCSLQADQDGVWQVDSGRGATLEFPWERPGKLKDALEWARLWNRQSFDLGKAPLWKMAWLDLEEGGCLLAFSFHHIIFDHHSIGLFYLKMDAYYAEPERLGRQVPPVLPRLPEGRPDVESEKAYWKSLLNKLPATPWFKRARMSDAVPASSIGTELPPDIVQGLKSLAVQERCTPFCVAALAWAQALAGLTGASTACFGAPFTLRDQPGGSRHIGFWVHPLPLRLAVPDGSRESVRACLAEASRQIRAAMGHRCLSFAEAMRASGEVAPGAFLTFNAGERDDFARTTSEGNHYSRTWFGKRATGRELDWGTVKVPLSLEVSGGEKWMLNLEWHPTAIDEAVARRLLEDFAAACRRYVEAGAPGGQAVFSAAAPVSQIGETVLDAFERRAVDHAQAVALVEEKGAVDYGLLLLKARSVARALYDAGVRPRQRVGVYARADSAWVAALLGCFEAGAVYVPLDPAFPKERLRLMIRDAGCVLVLSNLGTPAWAEEPWMDLEEALKARPAFVRERGMPGAGDPAYVMFTSGSSGRPKGVQVGHGALMNFALGMGARMRFSAQDRTLQFFSLSFDPSMLDVFPVLVAGGSVALPQRSAAPGTSELCNWVRKFGVTVLQFPTAYWHVLMREGLAEALVGEKRVRCLSVGGEAPSPEWVAHWSRLFGDRVAFFNAYGPTEACVAATVWEATGAITGPVPLGEPLPGVELAVVGSDGKALGTGENGELWIGGKGLADGYLEGAGVDASRFSPAAPDGGKPRAFYRTGDRVQWNPRNGLIFMGRMDRQVKVSGVRLDLGEVERLLEACPGVAAAAVEVQGVGEGRSLRVWVESKPGVNPTSADLKAWLKERIPVQCLPALVEVLEQFPLGATGKVDRKALLERSAIVSGESTVPRVDSPHVEKDALGTLCEIFGEALGRSVGPDDDFFALGGSSLKAVHMAGEIGRRLERNVGVDQIYAYPTPRSLGAGIAGATASDVRAVGNEGMPELIRKAFSEALGCGVALNDDFFALGGSSLRAVHAAAEIGRRADRTVPVDWIYSHPSPLALAGRLESGGGAPALKAEQSSAASVHAATELPLAPGFEGVLDAHVPRNAKAKAKAAGFSTADFGEGTGGGGTLKRFNEGPGIPWVLLPPVSGRLECYRPLSSHLNGRCPIFGFDLGTLPPPGETGWSAWVEACAWALEREMPRGDLILGGWSMGGLLAADLARLMGSRGRTVRRLLLIDAALPDPLENALLLSDDALTDALLARDLRGPVPVGEAERERYRRHARALTGFVARPLEMPLSLVLSEKTAQEQPRNAWMAWSLMARAGMTCQLLPGDHYSILESPGLARTALRLMEEIAGSRTAVAVP